MTLSVERRAATSRAIGSSEAAGPPAPHVHMRFGSGETSVTALQDCSVAVSPGQRATIIGPSGCGKSTLLRIFANILESTSGEVLVGGASPSEAPQAHAYSFVFQNSVMLP